MQFQIAITAIHFARNKYFLSTFNNIGQKRLIKPCCSDNPSLVFKKGFKDMKASSGSILCRAYYFGLKIDRGIKRQIANLLQLGAVEITARHKPQQIENIMHIQSLQILA